MPTQHIATLLGATCCVRLATLLRHVATCWVLLAQIWPVSNLSQQQPTCRSMSQQGDQTHSTCCAQQFCDLLRWHVAIVLPGLNVAIVWPGLYTPEHAPAYSTLIGSLWAYQSRYLWALCTPACVDHQNLNCFCSRHPCVNHRSPKRNIRVCMVNCGWNIRVCMEIKKLHYSRSMDGLFTK